MNRPVRTDANERVEADLLGGMWGCSVCGRTIAPARPLLIDGHNRYGICQRHGIPFETDELQLDARAEVINWIIDNQLGRRNLTEEQKSFLRGQRHRQEHIGLGGDRKQNVRLTFCSTAERLAEQYGVSRKTIDNDARFAEAVDTIEETAESLHPGAGADAKNQILSGTSGLNRGQVRELGKMIEPGAPTVTGTEISDYAIVTDDGKLRQGNETRDRR